MSSSPKMDAAGFVDQADAVGVAVKGDAEVGFLSFDGCRSRSLRLSATVGSGMVIGKAAVELAEKRDDLGAQALEKLGRDRRGGAVAGVEHDLSCA